MLPQLYIEPVRSLFNGWQRQRYWRARTPGQVFQHAKLGGQRYLLLTTTGQFNYLAWAVRFCRREALGQVENKRKREKQQRVFCLQLSSGFLTMAWDDTVLLAYVFTDSPPEFLLGNLAQRVGFQPRVYFYEVSGAGATPREQGDSLVASSLPAHTQQECLVAESASALNQLLGEYFLSPCERVCLRSLPGQASAVPGDGESRFGAGGTHSQRKRMRLVSVIVLLVVLIAAATLWWVLTVIAPSSSSQSFAGLSEQSVSEKALRETGMVNGGNDAASGHLLPAGMSEHYDVFPALFVLPELVKGADFSAYQISLVASRPSVITAVDNQGETIVLPVGRLQLVHEELAQGELGQVELARTVHVLTELEARMLGVAESAFGEDSGQPQTWQELTELVHDWLPEFELRRATSLDEPSAQDVIVRFNKVWLEELATFALLAYTYGFGVTLIHVHGDGREISGEIRFWPGFAP